MTTPRGPAPPTMTGLPAQLGPPPDLDRGEERVHVDVQDRAAGVVGAGTELPRPATPRDLPAATHVRRLARRYDSRGRGDDQRDLHLGGGARTVERRPCPPRRPARTGWPPPRYGRRRPSRPRRRSAVRCASGDRAEPAGRHRLVAGHHPGRGAEHRRATWRARRRRRRGRRAGSAPGARRRPRRPRPAARDRYRESKRPSGGTFNCPWSAVTTSAASAGSRSASRATSRSTPAAAVAHPWRRRARTRARPGPRPGGTRRPRSGRSPAARPSIPSASASASAAPPVPAPRYAATVSPLPANSGSADHGRRYAGRGGPLEQGRHRLPARRVGIVAPLDMVEHPAGRRVRRRLKPRIAVRARRRPGAEPRPGWSAWWTGTRWSSPGPPAGRARRGRQRAARPAAAGDSRGRRRAGRRPGVPRPAGRRPARADRATRHAERGQHAGQHIGQAGLAVPRGDGIERRRQLRARAGRAGAAGWRCRGTAAGPAVASSNASSAVGLRSSTAPGTRSATTRTPWICSTARPAAGAAPSPRPRRTGDAACPGHRRARRGRSAVPSRRRGARSTARASTAADPVGDDDAGAPPGRSAVASASTTPAGSSTTSSTLWHSTMSALSGATSSASPSPSPWTARDPIGHTGLGRPPGQRRRVRRGWRRPP